MQLYRINPGFFSLNVRMHRRPITRLVIIFSCALFSMLVAYSFLYLATGVLSTYELLFTGLLLNLSTVPMIYFSINLTWVRAIRNYCQGK